MDTTGEVIAANMILHNFVQATFMLAGIIALLASLLDWDWFFTADNASFLVKRLGRNGARLAYGAIGLIFIAASVYFHCKTQFAFNAI